MWRQLGDRVLVENMDKRKPVGRTVEELDLIFEQLPAAGMCFDIAHARQVDSSMTEARTGCCSGMPIEFANCTSVK